MLHRTTTRRNLVSDPVTLEMLYDTDDETDGEPTQHVIDQNIFEWEPMPPINESLDNITVCSSIDPGLHLIVPDDKRVKLSSKDIDTASTLSHVKRVCDEAKRRRDDELSQADAELEAEMAMLRRRHRQRRARIISNYDWFCDTNAMLMGSPFTRQARLTAAALKIGAFEPDAADAMCTLCIDVIGRAGGLKLHGCGHIFHFEDECISMLLARSNCPNCRSHYKTLKQL